MNKKVTLYNVMFPIWMILLFPQTILLAIPINFLMDSLCLLISGKVIKLKNNLECYKKTILKSTLFGYISDIFGAIFLLIPVILPESILKYKVIFDIRDAVIANPFSNVFSFIYVLIAIIVSMFFIYNLNLKFNFKKINIENKEKKLLALALMFVTAPYTFLIPTSFMYL